MNIRTLEWTRYKGTAAPGSGIIGSDDLSDELRDMLLYESVVKYIQNVPFLRGATDSFLLDLCHHVQTFLFNPGDIIVYKVSLKMMRSNNEASICSGTYLEIFI